MRSLPTLLVAACLAGPAFSQTMPASKAASRAIPGTRPGTERWIVHFESRPFDLQPLRRAHEAGSLETVQREVADLEKRMRRHQKTFCEDVVALGGRVALQYWLVNACVIEVARRHLATIRRLPNVASLQPDIATHPLAPIKTATNASNHEADALQSAGHTGDGVAVAIIDTGHDEKTGNTNRPHVIYSRRGTSTTRLVLNRQLGTEPADDVQGHGTAVASVAAGFRWNTAAADHGHAFDADIAGYAIALDKNGSSSISIMAKAYELIAGGDAKKHGIKVTNLSFTGSTDPLSVEQKAADAAALVADVLNCTAAGNSGADVSRSPINLNGLTVGATTANSKNVANFSSRGLLNGRVKLPVLCANGVGIVMAQKDDESKDAILDGTSFASPQVAGAATQLRARFPNLNALETKAILVAATEANPGTGPNQVATGPGCGYLNNRRAHEIASNPNRFGRGALRNNAVGRIQTFAMKLEKDKLYQVAVAWNRQDVSKNFWANVDISILQGRLPILGSRERESTVEFLRFRAPATGDFTMRVITSNALADSLPYAFATTFDVTPATPGTFTVNVNARGCAGSGPNHFVLPTAFRAKMGPPVQERRTPFGEGKKRFQQVFQVRTGMTPNSAMLDGIALRQPRTNGKTGGTQFVEVHLGFTQLDHLTMTTTFDRNPISNSMVKVFDGIINFPPQTAKNDDPRCFAFRIRFQRPFAYTLRNLVLEVVNKSTSNIKTTFDHAFEVGNLTSRIIADSVDAKVGKMSRHLGLTVRFDIAGGINPKIGAIGTPIINETFRITLRAARANSAAALAIGLRRTGLRLPGAPQCRLFTTLDLFPFAIVPTNKHGEAETPFPIPNDPGMFGLVFHAQWWVFDPKANAVGIALSSGATGVIGRT